MTTKNKSSDLTLRAKIIKVLRDYLVTQFVLMIIVFIAVLAILTMLKVKYALLLAILTGVLSIIPNYGMVVSTIIVAAVASFDNVTFIQNVSNYVEGVAIILILVVLNKIIDTFLSPILLGKTNKISPLTIFIVVMLGTLTFGILGAVLSVPILLVTKTIWEHYKEVYNS